MALTPLDIQQQRFRSRFGGGVDKNEVDAFLHLVTTEFEKLQKISEPIDLDAPIFQRISRIAEKHWGIANWKRPYSPPTPVGERPSLDSLGPLCWGPSPAFPFTLKDSDGNKVSLSDYQKAGKPVLVIFYLGAGCRQCMEQLNLFSPLASEFEKAGISLLAISTDSVKGLKSTITSDPKAPKFNYPLLSDEKLQVFKAYRAYDDFEGMPLHGCYLIDKNGYVRWQDISFQPFKETSFLLEECKRLLQISPTPSTLNASIAELK